MTQGDYLRPGEARHAWSHPAAAYFPRVEVNKAKANHEYGLVRLIALAL